MKWVSYDEEDKMVKEIKNGNSIEQIVNTIVGVYEDYLTENTIENRQTENA